MARVHHFKNNLPKGSFCEARAAEALEQWRATVSNIELESNSTPKINRY
jgi:hypothetical protein